MRPDCLLLRGPDPTRPLLGRGRIPQLLPGTSPKLTRSSPALSPKDHRQDRRLEPGCQPWSLPPGGGSPPSLERRAQAPSLPQCEAKDIKAQHGHRKVSLFPHMTADDSEKQIIFSQGSCSLATKAWRRDGGCRPSPGTRAFFSTRLHAHLHTGAARDTGHCTSASFRRTCPSAPRSDSRASWPAKHRGAPKSRPPSSAHHLKERLPGRRQARHTRRGSTLWGQPPKGRCCSPGKGGTQWPSCPASTAGR